MGNFQKKIKNFLSSLVKIKWRQPGKLVPIILLYNATDYSRIFCCTTQQFCTVKLLFDDTTDCNTTFVWHIVRVPKCLQILKKIRGYPFKKIFSKKMGSKNFKDIFFGFYTLENDWGLKILEIGHNFKFLWNL